MKAWARKNTCSASSPTPEQDGHDSVQRHMNLREERKRTGRYVAAGTAIFLSVLGVYQALIQGTPEYAALFAPAVIMFMYVLWILHTSRHQNARRLLRLKQAAASRELLEEVVMEPTTLPEKIVNATQINDNPKSDQDNNGKTATDTTNNNKTYYSRSYSIA
ncbi:hypothetical protein RN001_014671 [Aquatica leii]|uniref:Uncharacterized protein n=1 Tax=Aquatica leii TaxID=1421715 RepID=A0AAN7SBK3_9COLE|nr:hypothetical protein RN001_014671 [Aquatica leii]